MIDDLELRRAHWDKPENRAPRDEHDLTDSLPYPFEGVEHLFDGKDVLEIGPGRGRQYERIKTAVQSYSVCDISPAALTEPVFADVTARYLLSDYGKDFTDRFDVVHFWYVLHHVRLDELGNFFGFVARHLRTSGMALFNSPQVGDVLAYRPGDGLGTTLMDRATVMTAYASHLNTVGVCYQNDRSSGDLFIARKR